MAGVEDDADNDEDINDETGNHNNSSTIQERTYHMPDDQFSSGIRMKLCNQPRREYNVFNVTSEIENKHIVMLQFDANIGIAEETMDKTEAEWMFLTEQLG